MTIESLFDSFSRKRILVIGDIMVDAYLWGSVDRISPEAPVPVVALRQRESRLGGAANVALNIRQFGANVILCSVTGDDEKGREIGLLLEKAGISDLGIIRSEKRKTTVKFRILGNKTQLLRVDEEDISPLDHDLSTSLVSVIKEQASDADAIVFEDYDKGVITKNLIKEVVSIARDKDIPILVDPKKNHFLDYSDIDLFKPNLRELKEGLKTETDLQVQENIEAAVSELHKRLGVKSILVTMSEKGMFYSERDGEAGFVPAHIRNIADVSGAGDTVISIAALCLASRVPLPFTAALCNLAGGLVCEQPGVVPVSREKLLKEAIKHLKHVPA